jgi:hypothetical protein
LIHPELFVAFRNFNQAKYCENQAEYSDIINKTKALQLQGFLFIKADPFYDQKNNLIRTSKATKPPMIRKNGNIPVFFLPGSISW